MAKGLLGKGDVNTGSSGTIYTCPAGNYAVVHIALYSQTGSSGPARLYLTTSIGTTNLFSVGAGSFESTSMMLSAGNSVVLDNLNAGGTAYVSGYEVPV